MELVVPELGGGDENFRIAAAPAVATVADADTALVYPEHTARKVYVPALLIFSEENVKAVAPPAVCRSVPCSTAPFVAIRAR